MMGSMSRISFSDNSSPSVDSVSSNLWRQSSMDDRLEQQKHWEKDLAVELVGIRDVDPKYVKMRLQAKLSLNSAFALSGIAKGSPSKEGNFADFTFENDINHDWGIHSMSDLSHSDLFIIRVKCLKKIGVSKRLGIVSLSIKKLLAVGSEDSLAWFPLFPYKKSDDPAPAKVGVKVYWKSVTKDELWETDSKSSNQQSHLDFSQETVSTKLSQIESVATKLNGLGKKVSSLRVPGQIRSMVRGYTHHAQESLLAGGAPEKGLTNRSAGVEAYGPWLDEPVYESDEEEDETDQFIPDVTLSSLIVTDKTFHIDPILAKNHRSCLYVHIYRARGLCAKDFNGLSDPYCLLRIKSAKRKSNVVPRSLAPKWYSNFIFGGDENGNENISLDDILYISVRDKDVGHDSDLGVVEIPLWVFIPSERNNSSSPQGQDNLLGLNSPITAINENYNIQSVSSCGYLSVAARWYSLQPSSRSKKSSARGEIKIRFSYYCGKKVASDDLSEEVDDDCYCDGNDRSSINFDARSKEETQVMRSSFNLYSENALASYWFGVRRYCKARSVLFVRCIEARSLVSMDINGLSDPFVKCQIRSLTSQTQHCTRTLNPVWNTTLALFSHQELLTELDLLQVTVLDHDRFRPNENMGFVEIPLWSIVNSSPTPKWYALESQNFEYRPVNGQFPSSFGEVKLQIILSSCSFESMHTIKSKERTSLPVEIDSSNCFANSRDRSCIQDILQTNSWVNMDMVSQRKRFQYKPYGGRVWSYEMKVKILRTSIAISHRNKPKTSLTLSCGADSFQAEPTGRNRSFVFRNGFPKDSRGLGRQDCLTIALSSSVANQSDEKDSLDGNVVEQVFDSSSGKVLAFTHISIGYIVDRMGYIDRDGSELRDWFVLDSKMSLPTGGTVDSVYNYDNTESKVRLLVSLKPTMESRLTKRHKIIVSIDKVRGFNPGSYLDVDSLEKVYFTLGIGTKKYVTALRGLCHGHGICNIHKYFTLSDDEERYGLTVDVDVCSPSTGAVLGSYHHSLVDVLISTNETVEGWYPVLRSHNSEHLAINEANSTENVADVVKNTNEQFDCLGSETNSRFAGMISPYPEVYIRMSVVEVAETLVPILGELSVKLSSLKLNTNDFLHDIQCVVKHEDRSVATRIYSRAVHVNFEENESRYLFPVLTVSKKLYFEVWKVSGSSRKSSKRIGSASLSLFDILENQVEPSFQKIELANKASGSLKLPLIGAKNKVTGTLRLKVLFRENLLNGTLATSKYEGSQKSVPFSVANIRHEVFRFLSIYKDISHSFGAFSSIFGWRDFRLSVTGCVFLIVFTMLPFCSSRVLAFIPLCAILEILRRYRKRISGKFVTELLRSGGLGEQDATAQIRIAIDRGRNILIPDWAKEHKLMVEVSCLYDRDYTQEKSFRSSIGKTSAISATSNPIWSESRFGFAAHTGTSLVQWRRKGTENSGEESTAFETFVPRPPASKPNLDVISIGMIWFKPPVSSAEESPSFEVDQDFICIAEVIRYSKFADAKLKMRVDDLNWQLYHQPVDFSLLKIPFSRIVANVDEYSSAKLAAIDLKLRRKSIESNKSDCDTSEKVDNDNPHDMENETEYEVPRWLQYDQTVNQGKIETNRSAAVKLSPKDKLMLFSLHCDSSFDDRAKKQTQAVSMLSPKCQWAIWNETLHFDPKNGLDRSDFLVVSIQIRKDKKRSGSESTLACAFVNLDLFESATERMTRWFPLEMPVLKKKHHMSSPPSWCVVGRILLSLRLDAVTKEHQQTERIRRGSSSSAISSEQLSDIAEETSVIDLETEDMEIKVLDIPGGKWTDSNARLMCDVFGQDRTRKTFLGRATVPFSSLITNDQVKEQPVISSEWIPLSLRFDGSRDDQNLWNIVQGVSKTKKYSSDLQDQLDKPKLRTYRRALGTVGASLAKISNFKYSRRSLSNELPRVSSFYRPDDDDPGLSVQRFGESQSGSQSEDDFHANFFREEAAIFGEIQVSAQIILPDIASERAYIANMEAKTADKAGLIEQMRVLRKLLQTVQNTLRSINNTIERIFNLFNWVHPKKTQLILYIFFFLLGLFIVIPSRFVVLFLAIYIFTERFRPLGSIFIKIKHMVAVMPTREDLVSVYKNDPLGFSMDSDRVHSTKAAIGDESVSQDYPASLPEGVETSSFTKKLTEPKFYQSTLHRIIPVLRLSPKQGKDRLMTAYVQKRLVSEPDIKVSGHMRFTSEHRSWRRSYFAVAHQTLLFWDQKADMYRSPAKGTFGEITAISKISKDSEDAKALEKKGLPSAFLSSAFYLDHRTISTNAEKKRRVIRTYFSVNTSKKCDAWISELSGQAFDSDG